MYAALHVTCKFRIAHGHSDYNEDELARACLAWETAEQKEKLRDRAWRDAQASSNRDRGDTDSI